ncbi:methylase involved in ubiquinone/menaquinone biosynthesis [Rubidibacter lacunae KORDI 51-2]|uniref:Methylase involved in ubiquinone/menaquinone biosynthesis n=1 Tax=Rubidibacter lacunae KORDI 51-2 TaxID=582515 RepID=U5DPD4_9CHRO|nr:class I SAM-dependent methyltransferase [Rubidibacter lacunae]ERN42707.1 methylase involved in ubiquinone/menaquinone biosynthesis [Rubidibacter lacunae KORDI 51-2]
MRELYSRVLFPRLLDWVMSAEAMAVRRRQLLAAVEGNVLEIGCGTGLNFAFYPPSVRTLVATDPNPGMMARARERAAAAPIAIALETADAQELPFADGTYDCAVSTWTLCSIPSVERSLQEIRRVLKPSGRLFFVEHGLCPEPNLSVWQRRLTPIQKRIADGCHLDRAIDRLIAAEFAMEQLENSYLEDTAKFAGYLYQGVAIAPAT